MAESRAGQPAESLRALVGRLAAGVLQANTATASRDDPGALRRAQDTAHSILLGLSPVSPPACWEAQGRCVVARCSR